MAARCQSLPIFIFKNYLRSAPNRTLNCRSVIWCPPPRTLLPTLYEKAAILSCQRFVHSNEHREDGSRDRGSGGGKKQQEAKFAYWSAVAAAVGLVCGASAAGYTGWTHSRGPVFCAAESDPLANAGIRRPDLPDFTLDEVAEHATPDTRIWVTFRGGVYDITDFVAGHPGGPDKILMAVGGSLEPFWEMYGVHKTAHVLEILESLRIGNVSEADLKQQRMEAAGSAEKKEDFYANEPKRHPALKVCGRRGKLLLKGKAAENAQVNVAKPFNAETPVQLLTDNMYTPNELFFVRNHLPVPPDLRSGGRWAAVEICGVGLEKPVRLTVDELKAIFAVHTIASTVQCAGNRRSEMHRVKAVRGIQWGTAAVSNAEWTGVKLADVLAAVGAREDRVRHVLFQGMDRDIEGLPYEASIPAETAFDPRRDVLLAFEMNGKELPRDHGYPLRVIVPGTIGARQVKWVERIILDTEESQSFWQQKDYKTLNPSTDWDSTDLSQSLPIQDFPVQSAICEPSDGASVTVDHSVGGLVLKGYAVSGGGRGIVRVDVSVDGGKTWKEARLRALPQTLHRRWAWTLWEAVIPWEEVTAAVREGAASGGGGGGGRVEVTCKATDTSHNTQPEGDEGIWNMRGLLEHKWHRILVDVVDPK